MGLEVLRFSDRDVKLDISNVLRGIEGWIEERWKTSSDSRYRSAGGTTPSPPSNSDLLGEVN
jgi:hypothetical protein